MAVGLQQRLADDLGRQLTALGRHLPADRLAAALGAGLRTAHATENATRGPDLPERGAEPEPEPELRYSVLRQWEPEPELELGPEPESTLGSEPAFLPAATAAGLEEALDPTMSKVRKAPS